MFIVKNSTNGRFLGTKNAPGISRFCVRSPEAQVFRTMSGVLNAVGRRVPLSEQERMLPKYRNRMQTSKRVLPENLEVYKVNITLERTYAPPVRRGS